MARSSFPVFGFFFVVLVVLKSAYVTGAGPAASPGDYGLCDADGQLDIGTFLSCEMCHAACPSTIISICLSDSVNTGP
ncbi:hypothetical protein MKX03_017699 [Papaver bracteatum]|nr:hypothetical protein MKX03_017699 [Papaver bracteatum]